MGDLTSKGKHSGSPELFHTWPCSWLYLWLLFFSTISSFLRIFALKEVSASWNKPPALFFPHLHQLWRTSSASENYGRRVLLKRRAMVCSRAPWWGLCPSPQTRQQHQGWQQALHRLTSPDTHSTKYDYCKNIANILLPEVFRCCSSGSRDTVLSVCCSWEQATATRTGRTPSWSSPNSGAIPSAQSGGCFSGSIAISPYLTAPWTLKHFPIKCLMPNNKRNVMLLLNVV